MSDGKRPRAPQVFEADDAALTHDTAAPTGATEAEDFDDGEIVAPPLAVAAPARGLGWGSLLLGALGSLGILAAGVWFARFVSIALERQDWVGWLAFSLLSLAALAAFILIAREIVGYFRLAGLTRLKAQADQALADRDPKAERNVAKALVRHLSGRPELKWNLARFAEHQGDVQDAGNLLKLADRELLAPLDGQARAIVAASAKRVGMVTLISPIGLVTVGFIVYENLGMLRRLAGVYGGRPGFLGSMRLARMVFLHILASGGLALTDDFLGQFLGQDLVRRLSKKLGEGVFNGALTARVGTAAIEVTRPLPFIASRPVRFRDFRGALMTEPVRDAARGIWRRVAPKSKTSPEPSDSA